MDREYLNKALEKFSIGNALSDDELVELIKFFRQLEADLGSMTHHFNPGFGLAFRATMHEMQKLKLFKEARLRHNR